MNGSCVDENSLLMSEVRGEWADWLEMIGQGQGSFIRHILNYTEYNKYIINIMIERQQ